MKAFLRVLVVCAALVGLIVLAQLLLSRDEPPAVRLSVTARTPASPDAPPLWQFTVGEGGLFFLDGRTATVDDMMERLRSAADAVDLAIVQYAKPPADTKARAADRRIVATADFRVDKDGRVTEDGKPSSLAALRASLDGIVKRQLDEGTHPATVADVLAAVDRGELPRPVIDRVDFPDYPYRKSWPDATDQPELAIREFHGHPMYDDPAMMPAKLKPFYAGQTFPPVAERLPKNPAVLRGIDGVGVYGEHGQPMIWYRAAGDDNGTINTKIGYPALVRFDWAGRLQPNIAYRWTVEDNNRVFTFWLRPGMKWSDGKPYTTDDILFVLNDIIGSPAWSQLPNWMQETDGSAIIYEDDVTDWPALAARIRQEWASSRPSPGRQLLKVINADATGRFARLKKAIETMGAAAPDEDTRIALVGDINAVVKSRDFFSRDAWAGVDFTSELEQLDRAGYSRLDTAGRQRHEFLMMRADWLTRADAIHDESGDDETRWRAGEVTQFGVLLFRAAYRDFVKPAVRQRVRIEAVADEDGDTSHILRFTFPRPNSIFLETNATFMLYLGVFNTQKAFREPFFPFGSPDLRPVDILAWRDLFDGMRKAAESPVPSPGRHIWGLLSDDIRQKLSARIPSDDRAQDADYKKELCDALSIALHRRDFYDALSWAHVDLATELQKFREQHYSRIQERDKRRYLAILTRADYLRRGVDDLSDAELFDFNLKMFRAAWAGNLETGDGRAVAINREDALDREAQWRGYRTWNVLWSETSRFQRGWNEHVPTIGPWRVVTDRDDATQYFVRNPYYFKVDAAGNQLPYIDLVQSEVAARKEIRLLKLRAGPVGMQARNLEWDDFTPLKQNEKAGNYRIHLWANDYVGEMTFWFGQAHADPEYRELEADPRFRQAMSLALNRQEMIDVVWQGMGTPAQFSIPEGSKYYSDKLFHAFVDYDPARANKLLDEMGLDKRAADGTRLLWSGRPLVMEVGTVQERPLAAIQMACEYWRAIGVKPLMRIYSGAIQWRLFDMGKYDIWTHKEGGNYFGPLIAGFAAPTHQAESIQYSRWASWLRSAGRTGEEPPDRVKNLDVLWSRVITAPSEPEKIRRWNELMDVTAEQLPVLGIMTSPGKVVYVHNRFKNVPRLALAGWIAHEPGNCNPETFYVEPE